MSLDDKDWCETATVKIGDKEFEGEVTDVGFSKDFLSEEELLIKNNPHIVDIRELSTKWVCEFNDKSFRADAPAHCPHCGQDLRYDKYHENHYREMRFYREYE